MREKKKKKKTKKRESNFVVGYLSFISHAR